MSLIINGKNYSLKIGSEIAQGGFSTISECNIYTEKGELFKDNLVIKKLTNDYDLNQIHRFDREMKYLEQLNHKNILKPFYFDFENGFILMERYPWNLEDYILRNEINDDEITRIFLEILDGVSYYVDEGVLHRDLKPKNILINHTGEVKIADFGLSSRVNRGDTRHLTRAKFYAGSEFYSAPELLSGDGLASADVRSDIYSLGKILYSMKTKNFSTLVLEDLDPVLRHFIKKSTAHNPEDRFQNIDELIHNFKLTFKAKEVHNIKDYRLDSIVEEIQEIIYNPSKENYKLQTILKVISDEEYEDAVELSVSLDPTIHLELWEVDSDSYTSFISNACDEIKNSDFLFGYVDTITNSLISVLRENSTVIDIELQAIILHSLINVSTNHNRFNAMQNVANYIESIEEKLLLEVLSEQKPRISQYQIATLKSYKTSKNLKSLEEIISNKYSF